MAERLYSELTARGIEVLLDDRDERAGVKFMDADLIGIPLRVNIGPKRLQEGLVELKFRRTGEVKVFPPEELINEVEKIVKEALSV